MAYLSLLYPISRSLCDSCYDLIRIVDNRLVITGKEIFFRLEHFEGHLFDFRRGTDRRRQRVDLNRRRILPTRPLCSASLVWET